MTTRNSAPVGRDSTLGHSLFWCGRRDSNPHEGCPSAVFKTAASAIPPRPRSEDSQPGALPVTPSRYTKTPGQGPGDAGAEDGIRTRDLLLGKEMLYH